MSNLLGTPLGWIMYACYSFTKNYGLALILFTLITKLVMLPFAIGQQKNMARMAVFRPKMEEIQQRYKTDSTKLNEELSALYKRENYSPTAGCLPLFIQFPILIGLINVIYNPLKHILQIPEDIRLRAIEIMQTVLDPAKINSYSKEMSVITAFQQDPTAFASLGQEFSEKLAGMDFTFLGIDMGAIPTLSFATPEDVLLLLIPLLSGISALLVSYLSTRNNAAVGGANAGMNLSMMLMMPLTSMYIAFRVPAGVGAYWVLSNVYTLVQNFILGKIYDPAEHVARVKAEIEQQKLQEKQEKKEARQKQREAGESDERGLSQKEINRRKLAEARRRDAEKYGEEYVEVTDADVE